MRVAIEIRNVSFGASGGIAPLVRGVVGEAMRRNPDVEFTVFATLFNSDFFGELPSNATMRILPPHAYWADMAAELRQGSFDALFRAYPGPDVAGYPASRQVVLIPDMQHEAHPEFFSEPDLAARRRLFGAVLQTAGAIGTISAFARDHILAHRGNRCADVFLMPPASQLDSLGECRVSADFVARVTSLSPYLFYPANLWKHKNHDRLLAAYERFREGANANVHLVLSGHPEGWSAVSRRDLPGVHHLGYVAPAELGHLYRNARALVFPSLYEGFGMPLLEAFEYGCPVACSNITSLPEVAGEAALLFDPSSVDAIAGAMTTITGDAELRRTLAARGRQRLSHYSWTRSAAEWMDACRRVRVAVPKVATGERPLVSIVTPSYNQGRFLRRTIESVLTQDYPNIELIVMDGGSTDESVGILESYGDRIAWVSEKDRGQTHAINKGLARARGSILAYLNSDDTLEPNAISRVVQYFADNPSCDMMYGDANYIDEADAVTGRYNTDAYSFERLMRDCCVCQPAAFWRASIAKRVGPFDEKLDFVMDYDYWLRIDRAGGEIRFLPEILANSRLYAQTKTMSSRDAIYREIFEVCKRHGGYVDRSYYHGYWDHRINERSGVVSRVLRRVPGAGAFVAKLHHAFDHRTGSAWSFFAGQASQKLGEALKKRLASSPGAPKRVQGFYLDGWLGPRADIRRTHAHDEPTLFVTGRPAVPCTVDVVVDGVTVRTQALTPDAVSRIEVEAEVRDAVSLRFSSHAIDAAQRPLAFLVFGTNLFSEADLAA